MNNDRWFKNRDKLAGRVNGTMKKSRNIGSLNILFTCIGRRVSLLKSFKKAAQQLKINAVFFGADTTELTSAMQLCDKRFIVKPTTDGSYIREILEIVKKNRVKLLVPTVDLDLKLLAQNKDKFAELGCVVLVSDLDVINICQDKRKSCRFLLNNGFSTPKTISPGKALSAKKMVFPCFLKPWDGYASRGNEVVKNRKELEFFSKRIPNCIVQELVDGSEYTCDAYVDFDMRVRCVVPRKRLQVRAGEVSKGQVIKDRHIMNEVAKLVEKLRGGPGVLTIQLFVTKNDVVKFTEVNPRFGGGVPLSIKAGANFPKWILSELTGKKPAIQFDGFRDNLIMLRYDDEIWVQPKG
ncbi:MAG: ATP-grasp domain-containing protein [Candidatus Brocadiia bacterium]|nr:MAG: ATP-grasp domain-containing protein [Candidatus Brocadiia bacterium]